MRFPSTPVTNEGPISNGNVVAAGSLEEEAAEEEPCGASKPIFATASPSRISSEGKRRDISLYIRQLTAVANEWTIQVLTSCTCPLYCSDTQVPVWGSRS